MEHLLSVVQAKKTDLDLFRIWHKRYVEEYRKTESRPDRKVTDHVNIIGWNSIDSNPIYWIKYKNQTIGYVTTLVLRDTLNPDIGFNVIEDMYVSKQHRHKGIATFIRNMLRHDFCIEGVLIDKARLIKLCVYYIEQGFKSMNFLPDHDLIVIRYADAEPAIGWKSMVPNK
jgi:hypothetical protein